MSEGESRPPAHVYGLLGLMIFLWSINFVVAKYALREFPPLMAGVLRFTCAGLIIGPLYLARRNNPGYRHIDWDGAKHLIGIGVLGVGLNQLFFLIGLERTSVGHAALLIVLTPVFVLALAALTGQEAFRKRKLGGFALAVAGIALLQAKPSSMSRFDLLGDVFILLACGTFAMFTVFGKGVVMRYHSLTVNTFAYVGSALLFSPLTLWYCYKFDFSAVTWKGWSSIVYMAAFPSVLCYLIYYYGLRFIPATRIAMLSYVQPLIAMSLAIVFLGERVTSNLLAGGALVLTGVILAERT